MEGRRTKKISLACRFIPYDQWFLTHIDPAWKIKDLKQIILARCLSLPFDPRKLSMESSRAARPPSPITFAPDESQRPISPVKFASPREVRKKRSAGVAFDLGDDSENPGGSAAGAERKSESADGGFFADGDDEGFGGGEEGYEEDDEWDDDDEHNAFVVGGGLVATGAKRSSVVMGGRVQIPGAPSSSAPVPGSSTSTAAGTPSSPIKIRKKFNPLAKIAASSFTAGAAGGGGGTDGNTTPPSSLPVDHPPSSTALVLQQQQQQPNAIYTSMYTLIRFSTGQILEEDIPALWYDLLPNELVELHASIPPLSFAMSVKLSWNLLNPTMMLQQFADRNRQLVQTRKGKGKDKSKSAFSGANNEPVDTNTLQHPISASLSLVSLPRHDPLAYAQPYWEGWVRALRMVYVGGDVAASNAAAAAAARASATAAARMNMQEYAMGMTNFSGNMGAGLGLVAPMAGGAGASGAGVDERGSSREVGGHVAGTGPSASVPTSRMQSRKEWRERYVVIKDGIVNIFKSRDDPKPTHRLPLTHLLSLRDVADLGSVLNKKPAVKSSTASVSSGMTGHATGDKPSHTRPQSRRRSRGASAAPTEGSMSQRDTEAERSRKRRSTSLPRSSTSTAKDYRQGGRTANAPVSQRAGASGKPSSSNAKAGHSNQKRGRSQDREHMNSSTSMPRHSNPHPPMTEAEREARRLAAQKRQKEREERERKRKQREETEKEMEYLKRWDDLSISFWPKKDKEKDKERDKGKGRERDEDGYGGPSSSKGKERERDRDTDHFRTRYDHQHQHQYYSDHQHDREGEPERDRDKERDRRRRDRERERERAKRDAKTFIPASREEAEAAGMKIVCAKFRQLRSSEREALDRDLAAKDPSASSGLKYTSTGPSLAGDSNIIVVSETESVESGTAAANIAAGGSGRMKHSKNGLSEDINNPYIPASVSSANSMPGPPRRPSLPALAGLLGAPSSVTSSATLAASSSSVAVQSIHSDTSGSFGGPNSSAFPNSGAMAIASPTSAPSKFMGGIFGKDKEEKERRAKQKELKALDKERQKAAKRREEKETGDEDDGGMGTGLSWKLRWNTNSAAGKTKERESIDTASTVTTTTMSPPPAISAAPSGSTLISVSQTDTEQLGEEIMASGMDDKPQDEAHRTTSLPNLRDESHPPNPGHRPKLAISPVNDSISQQNEQQKVTQQQHELQSDGPQSDSDSSSRSLSSPVFAHSDDGFENADDFNDEFGFGTSGYRRDRMGYRYGGYQQRKSDKSRSAASGVPSANVAFSATPAVNVQEAPSKSQRSQWAGRASDDVAEAGGVEKPRVADPVSGSGEANWDISQTRSTQSQPPRREIRRKREDDRGEWIVLDMGNEHAYSSILRVLHRQFSQPLTSTFVKSSITGIPTPSSTSALPADTSELASSKTTMEINSPTQANFGSSTTLVSSADSKSMTTDRTKSLRTVDSFSSMYMPPPPPSTRQADRPFAAGSDADDEEPQANTIPAQSGDQEPASTSQHHPKAEHPPILNAFKTSAKPKKRATLTPALQYPEWRYEIVERARWHGLREVGRPLDLTHGWSKESEESGLRGRLEARLKQKEDEDEKARSRANVQEVAGEEEEESEGTEDDKFEDAEEGGSEEGDHVPRGFDDERRRMSAISHVSTLNAFQMNAAAAAALANRPSVHDQTFVLDEDHDLANADQSRSSHDNEDGESIEAFEEGVFQQEYSFKYGHEDEEEAIALGMESFMEESEEESENEWVAWVTDLPRQVQVREAERKRIAFEKEMERRRLEEEKHLAAEAERPTNPQLSPMVFSDPFSDQQSRQSRSSNSSESFGERSGPEKSAVARYSRSAHGTTWGGQEEERRQIVESRRMMEPSATSTFIVPPPPSSTELPLQEYGPRPFASSGALQPSPQGSLLRPASFERTPAIVHVQSETRVGESSQMVLVPTHHLHRPPSRSNTTLSTQASLDSLSSNARTSFSPNVPPISVNVSSTGSRSPQLDSFSPESELTDGSRNAPSSSTTPPSATVQYLPAKAIPRTHSRTPSGTNKMVDSSLVPSRMSRLYHSTSMPLAAAANASPSSLASSVPSSPPMSPMRSISTSTSASMSTPSKASIYSHPIDMPILTPEQIRQIEVETEMKMQNSGKLSSSPPSSYASRMPIPMPRRSTSGGTSFPVEFGSGSPPSLSPNSPSESRIGLISSGSGSSMGRSASVSVKTQPPDSIGDRGGRGVLRKRLSDLGRQISGDEKDSPPSAKSRKPKLSLTGLTGGSSNQRQSEVYSPTHDPRTRGMRSPTTSIGPTSHAYGAVDSGIASGTGSGVTMASAKALLRRVRSGSSLRLDMHTEERESSISSSYPVPHSPTMLENASRGGSWGTEQAKKRKGPVDRLVRGLDSALEFGDGKGM